MINIDKIKYNSRILAIYIYLYSFLQILTPIINEHIISYISYLITIIIFIKLIVKNKYNIDISFIYYILITGIYICINLLCVNYKSYVFTAGFVFIMQSIIPFFIISSQNINFDIFIIYWKRICVCMTIILPVYILLSKLKIIGYGSISTITNLNCLIIIYEIYTRKGKNNLNLIILLLNLTISAIYGGRMSFISILTTIVAMYIYNNGEKNLKRLTKIVVCSICIVYIILNAYTILEYIDSILLKFNIHSRNIEKLLLQINVGLFDKSVVSGRDIIYDVAINGIKNSNGLPLGLGFIREYTHGHYYFAHNIILDFIITFGFIMSIPIIMLILIRLIYIHKIKNRNKDIKIIWDLILILGISYFTRSLSGAYFLADNVCIMFLSLVAYKFKPKSSNNYV